jgi:hypothetical protein
MRLRLLFVVCLLSFGVSFEARAQLTLLGQFNPSAEGDLCGLGYDQTDGNVWVYGCSSTVVSRYSSAGVFQSSVPRPGESANDVDVEFASSAFGLNAALVPKGTLVFVNGESGTADLYAVDKTSGAVVATLATSFGASHVVGGAYHPILGQFFLVQDNVPGATAENRVTAVDTVTGASISTFQTTSTGFTVSFGDLEVCNATGNLLLVSSIETDIAEFTPAGALVQLHPLPVGVSALSGIGVNDAAGEIWVSGTGGLVSRLGGSVCPALPSPIPTMPSAGFVGLALLIAGASVAAALRRRAV